MLWLTGNGKSPNTIRIYSDAALRLAGWLYEHEHVDDWFKVTKSHLLAYVTWLIETYARGYANNQYRALQGFFKWFEAEEQQPSPMTGLRPPSLAVKAVPVLSDDELAALIADAENQRPPDFESRRDAALIRFMAATGVRLSECAGLAVADVDVKGREALVTGKGNRQRVVKFDTRCAVAFDRYLRMRAKHKCRDSPRLWLGTRGRGPMTADGVGRVIERRGHRLGLHVYPHMLRHTFSHRWLDAGGAEGDLMELNGWESPEMLRRYGASARAARARRAYDRINVMGDI